MDVIPFEDGWIKRKDVYSDSVRSCARSGCSKPQSRAKRPPRRRPVRPALELDHPEAAQRQLALDLLAREAVHEVSAKRVADLDALAAAQPSHGVSPSRR
jgi:hypothetical protein